MSIAAIDYDGSRNGGTIKEYVQVGLRSERWR